MIAILKTTLMIGLYVAILGCQPAGESADAGTTADVGDDSLPPLTLNLDFCDHTMSVTNGTLCAIKPSALDARTKDQAGNATLQDRSLGFGYHVLAVPKDWRKVRRLWIHFTGTYGRPFNQNNQKYESDVLLDEILEQNYAVIQLAYDNRFSVNVDTCSPGQTPANPGANRDNCAGEVRQEVVTGVDTSPYRTTDQYNSIDFRLKTLLEFLAGTQEIVFPSIDPASFDWSLVNVSGHSQGSNMAYYIAKNRGVNFACLLAGAFDSFDSVNLGAIRIADWFLTPLKLTPVSRIGAFVATEDDAYPQFSIGHQVIGLTLGQELFETTSAPYMDKNGAPIDGHSAAVKDPRLKALRASACFRN